MHDLGEGLHESIDRLQREVRLLNGRAKRLEARCVAYQRLWISAERMEHFYFRRWMTACKLGGFGFAPMVSAYLEAHPEEARR